MADVVVPTQEDMIEAHYSQANAPVFLPSDLMDGCMIPLVWAPISLEAAPRRQDEGPRYQRGTPALNTNVHA